MISKFDGVVGEDELLNIFEFDISRRIAMLGKDGDTCVFDSSSGLDDGR